MHLFRFDFHQFQGALNFGFDFSLYLWTSLNIFGIFFWVIKNLYDQKLGILCVTLFIVYIIFGRKVFQNKNNKFLYLILFSLFTVFLIDLLYLQHLLTSGCAYVCTYDLDTIIFACKFVRTLLPRSLLYISYILICIFVLQCVYVTFSVIYHNTHKVLVFLIALMVKEKQHTFENDCEASIGIALYE